MGSKLPILIILINLLVENEPEKEEEVITTTTAVPILSEEKLIDQIKFLESILPIQEEIIGEVQASTTEATAEDPALTTFDENNFENEEEIVIDGFLIEKPQDESGTVVCDWESTKPCLWSEIVFLKTS